MMTITVLRFCRKRIAAILVLVGCGLAGTFMPMAAAQAILGQPSPPDREFIVGTRVAPPFSMKAADGHWDGITIDLWRHLAEQLHLHYRFEERDTVQSLIEAVSSGQVDVAAAALTVTASRRQALDFTQPFFLTGLGVAVPRSGVTAWVPVLRTLLSVRFGEGLLALLGIALTVGTLIWLFERKENASYGGRPFHGFVAGIWWAGVAMTQAGAAQDGPRSVPGRILAVIWMVASVVTVALFIASITSALTTQRLQGIVRNVSDLQAIRVGAVKGSSTEEFLTAKRVASKLYASSQDGLQALAAGRLDAFVYDRPLLSWMIKQEFPQLEVLGVTLDSQTYAMALPLKSTLRPALDVSLLETLRSEWWQGTRFQYLGYDPTE